MIISMRRTFAAGASASTTLSANLFRAPLSRGISHMGSLGSALRTTSHAGATSFTRSNRVAPLRPRGDGATQAAIDAATAAIIAEATRGGHPGAASTLTKCMPFQPNGAGGTQPGTGRDNGDAHGLLVVEELDNDVQAHGVKLFAPPGQGAEGPSSLTVAEAARRSAFADMLAPANVPTPYSSGLAQAALQSTPSSQRTAL